MLPSTAAAEQLFEQARSLSEDERRKLTVRLWKALPEIHEDPDDEGLTDEEWQAAWGEELRQRAQAIEDGTAKLLDGEAVMAEMIAFANSRP